MSLSWSIITCSPARLLITVPGYDERSRGEESGATEGESKRHRKKVLLCIAFLYLYVYGELEGWLLLEFILFTFWSRSIFEYFSIEEETDFFIFLEREILHLRSSVMPFETRYHGLCVQSLYTSFFPSTLNIYVCSTKCWKQEHIAVDWLFWCDSGYDNRSSWWKTIL